MAIEDALLDPVRGPRPCREASRAVRARRRLLLAGRRGADGRHRIGRRHRPRRQHAQPRCDPRTRRRRRGGGGRHGAGVGGRADAGGRVASRRRCADPYGEGLRAADGAGRGGRRRGSGDAGARDEPAGAVDDAAPAVWARLRRSTPDGWASSDERVGGRVSSSASTVAARRPTWSSPTAPASVVATVQTAGANHEVDRSRSHGRGARRRHRGGAGRRRVERADEVGAVGVRARRCRLAERCRCRRCSGCDAGAERAASVCNDSRIALRAGCSKPWGIVSSVGTGSVTAGVNREGRWFRTMAVGWGEPSGSCDAGSRVAPRDRSRISRHRAGHGADRRLPRRPRSAGRAVDVRGDHPASPPGRQSPGASHHGCRRGR